MMSEEEVRAELSELRWMNENFPSPRIEAKIEAFELVLTGGRK